MNGPAEVAREMTERDRDAHACHEAGHAVVAARLKVSFSYVTIEQTPMEDGFIAGHVRLTWRPRMQKYRWMRRDKAFREVSEAEIAAWKLRNAEALIVVGYAGRIAEEMSGGYHSEGDCGDLKQIAELAQEHALPPARLDELKDQAKRILALPEVKAAVIVVAGELRLIKTRLTSPEVRAIYNAQARWAKEKKIKAR